MFSRPRGGLACVFFINFYDVLLISERGLIEAGILLVIVLRDLIWSISGHLSPDGFECRELFFLGLSFYVDGI